MPHSLFYNSTSIHALPTLVASLYNASLSRATGGTQSIAAAAHALPRVSVEVAQRSLTPTPSLPLTLPWPHPQTQPQTPNPQPNPQTQPHPKPQP